MYTHTLEPLFRLTGRFLLICFLWRSEYGRLGLGPEAGDAKVPTIVPALADKACVEVACGTAVSFAITTSGLSPLATPGPRSSYFKKNQLTFFMSRKNLHLEWDPDTVGSIYFWLS